MITTTFTVAPSVPSKVYTLLSREVGPPSAAKHFDAGACYIQFKAFTLVSKPLDESGEQLELTIYFHDPEDPELTQIHTKVLRRIKNYVGVELDLLDPFK